MQRLGVFLIALGCFGAMAVGDEKKLPLDKLPAPASGMVDFHKDIKPILVKACISCHGAEKQRGGLRLDDGAAAFKGSNSGPVIVPGKSAASRLIHVVGGLDADVVMPPKGKDPLKREEIAKLRAWIDQGAPWPKETVASSASKSAHWAFQPIRSPALPALKTKGWARNGIDDFVLGKLEAEKISPSPEADKITLIRRLTLDLLGLPPTPKEVADFLNDDRTDAYDRLVDRLLASPHYGERWARRWLDLARYADSDGYEQDRERFYAWRYRDWVIHALNKNMPFDQFTIEQLAGDLLPDAAIEQKTATGFHRNTLTNREGGTDKEQFRVEAVVDRVNTTFKMYFGLTMGCAQCHDHKYDPISQREYYQLFAFFNSDEEVDLPAPLPGEEATYRKQKAAFDHTKAALQQALATYRKDDPKNDTKIAELTKALAAHEKKAPIQSMLPTLALGKGRKTHVLLRGDFLRPGVEVSLATPEVLHPLKAPAKPDRLHLARWIVDPANPLTARVISNWVWHQYFGRGLVVTLEDFGTQGEKPSHPELLDFLATEFVKNGWDMKALHKLIVTSATYRQSSAARPELVARDPANILLYKQNRLRLEAEAIRDNALAVSGLLTPTVGGPSVKPPQPAGVSEVTYANRAKWVESKGPDRFRRGMYTWFQRTSPYPMLMTFDAPDSNLCCVRREKSNTPLQALTLLNDPVFVECSQALARRVLAQSKGSPAERIDHAFRLGMGRAPEPTEKQALVQLWDDFLELARSNPKEVASLLGSQGPTGVSPAEAAAWVALSRTIMNLDEFVTRE